MLRSPEVVCGAGLAGLPGSSGYTVLLAGLELVLIAPGQDLPGAVDGAACQWVHFLPRAVWSPWLAWPSPHIALPSAAVAEELAQLFGQIQAACAGATASSQALAGNLVERLLINCHELCPAYVDRRADPRVQAACAYMAVHLDQELTLTQIGRHVCLSASRLAHVFRQHTGVNIVRWREEQRILLAKQLLQGAGTPVGVVAARVGYKDRLYFSRVFRKCVGVSPSAYRQSCGI